jgi:Family of unknown function (DUF6204)
MPTRIFRVVVRGHFHGLDAEQRANLVAEAPNYEIFKSAYTAGGTLTYEPNLVAFSFRYEVRDTDDSAAGAENRVIETALAKARVSLDAMGVDYRHLRATATDMARVWS